MNNKALLLAITTMVTVLGMVSIGSVVLPSVYNTAIGQESTMSNSSSAAARDAVGSPLYNLTIGDKSYPIKFNITGGILDTMAIDGDQAILLVNINASSGGNLEIKLPRDLIDSKTQSNTDKPYSVFEDDIDRSISFVETRTTDQARTLVITFNNEDNVIEIQGTTFNNEDNVIEIQGTEVLSEPGGEF